MYKIKTNISLVILIALLLQSCSIFKKADETIEEEDLRTRNFNFNRHLLEGARQKTLGNYEAALKNYSFAMRVDDTEPAVYYEIAGILSIQGDFPGALEYAQKAVDLDKHDNEFYRILLTDIYVRNNMLSRAIDVYEDLIKINPDQIVYYFELAELYFTIDNVRRAIRTLNRAEDYFGVMDFISLEKERMYRLDDNQRNAIREVQKLADKYPERTEYQVLLAESYIKSDMIQEAKQVFDKIDLQSIENGVIFFSIADFYRLIEEYDKTFDLLQKGFAAQDVDLDIKIKMMINLVTHMGEDLFIYKNASKLMDILMAVYPKNVKVRTLYSDFLIYDGKFEKAQKEFDFILNQEKSKFTIWEQALFLDHHLDDYEAMFERSKEASELFPNQPIFLLFYSISSFMTENYKDAVVAGENAQHIILDDDEMLIQILTFKADALRNLEKHEESDQTFEKILKINPDEVLVLNNYSYYLALRGEKLSKALDMSTRLMKLNDERASFLDTHAWVLYKNGKYDEALKFINRALEKEPQNPIHLEHKGDILYKLSNEDDALKYWLKAKQFEGESEFLEQKIEERTLIE